MSVSAWRTSTGCQVNVVVQDLYAEYPTWRRWQGAEVEATSKIVKPCAWGSAAKDISAHEDPEETVATAEFLDDFMHS